ncbi:MAG: hypothetical protein ACP5RC_09205, partial [Halothiobacillaceae bacterium]
QAKLGCAPAHQLFSLVESRIRRREGVAVPRSISDYELPSISDVRASLPAGVQCLLFSEFISA